MKRFLFWVLVVLGLPVFGLVLAYNLADPAQVQLRRGDILLKKQDYRGAVAQYNAALALQPELPEAYLGRGVAYRELGQHQEAMADLTAALKLNKNLAVAYRQRGLTYERQGDDLHAVEDYTKGIWLRIFQLTGAKIDPELARIYNTRGELYTRLGNYDLALQDFTSAAEFAPAYAEAYQNSAKIHTALGDPAAAQGDLARLAAAKQHTDYVELAQTRLQELKPTRERLDANLARVAQYIPTVEWLKGTWTNLTATIAALRSA